VSRLPLLRHQRVEVALDEGRVAGDDSGGVAEIAHINLLSRRPVKVPVPEPVRVFPVHGLEVAVVRSECQSQHADAARARARIVGVCQRLRQVPGSPSPGTGRRHRCCTCGTPRTE
jgi:hypothetical protein